MYFLTRPLRRAGAALRGSRIVVHAIIPCEPPSPEDYDPGMEPDDPDDQDYQAIEDDRTYEEHDEIDEEEMVTNAAGAPRLVPGRVHVDSAGRGRIDRRSDGRPSAVVELVYDRARRAHGPKLSGPTRFVVGPRWTSSPGASQNTPVEVWDGDEYAVPDAAVFGEQRLRMRIGVTRDIRTVTLTYAQFTDIGQIQIPRIDVFPEHDR